MGNETSTKKKNDDDAASVPLRSSSNVLDAAADMKLINFSTEQRRSSTQSPVVCLPISHRLIGSLGGGMYCRGCRRIEAPDSSLHDIYDSNNTSTDQLRNRQDSEDGEEDGHYDWDHISQHHKNMSPLVVAPMLYPPTSDNPGANAATATTVESILAEYVATCQFYGLTKDRANAGVLTTLRFSLPSLRVSGDFHDKDMLPLAELLLRHGNGYLKFIHRLDFSRSSKEGKMYGQGRPGFRSHGALTLAKVLQSSRHIKDVRLQGNRIGPYGAQALFLACSRNRSVQRLGLRNCVIGERGGMAFAEMVRRDISQEQCGLIDVDLSVNRIGYRASLAIEAAMKKRTEHGQDGIYVDLMGNQVLQEIFNGVTHGLGILLAIIGAVLLSKRAQGRSQRHVISCAVYSTSLLVLYTSSTLYHSFFALKTTRYIFEVFDKCAIYILIAGSYTPFITITMFQNHFHLMLFMLAFIWLACGLGIHVEYSYPTWPRKGTFGLCMYLGIGWVAIIAPNDVVVAVDQVAKNLIVLGGVGYTAGVPFFLRNNFLDHSIWHLFVLAGSMFHWFAVYSYMVFSE